MGMFRIERIRADALGGLIAIHDRHTNVPVDDIGSFRERLGDGVCPVLRHYDSMAFVFQEIFQSPPCRILIVHDEDR